MAIDPSIALNANAPTPVNPLDIATKGAQLKILGMQPALIQQQISASQANQAATEAQTPGLQADSDIKQRAAAFNKFRADNKDQWTNKDSPGFDKDLGYDPKAMVAAYANAGYDDMANIASTHIFDTQAKSIKNADDAQKVRDTTLANVANTVQAFRTQGKSEQFISDWISRASQFADQKAPGLQLGPQLATLTDPKATAGVLQATMTPLQVENLNIAKGNLAVSQGSLKNAQEATTQAGVGSNTGEAARNPSSPQSTAARAFAQGAGLPVTDGMSAADVANLPGYADAVKATVVPAGTKAAGVAGAVAGTQNAQAYDALLKPLNNLKAKGLLTPGTTVDAFIQQNLTRLQNDPDFRALQAGSANLPDINTKTNDVNGMLAQVKQLSSTAKSQAKTAGQVAGATTFNQTPGVNPPTNPGGSVRMIDRAGKFYNIPADQVQDALKDGLKKIGGK